MIALRLCLGCHFLYEGVWKINHRDEFSAEPFLSQAKGPLSGFFYAMIPDQYGRQRLSIQTGKDKEDKIYKFVDTEPIAIRWSEIRRNILAPLDPGPPASDEEHKKYKEFESKSQEKLAKFKESVKKYFEDQETVVAIEKYFESLDRFENDPERNQGAPFQKERRWNRMIELRAEAKTWIDEIASHEQAYLNALYDIMPDEYRAKFSPMPCTWKVWTWSQMQLINFAVTYGLTAIGICLLLGFFTRLSALGGAAFMCFVVMTQPAWPTIYPHDLPVVGHALLVNKDFIEMVALLVIASSPVGRWGGLDHFVHYMIVRPLKAKWGKS